MGDPGWAIQEISDKNMGVHSAKKMAEVHVEIVYALLIIGGGRGSNTLRWTHRSVQWS